MAKIRTGNDAIVLDGDVEGLAFWWHAHDADGRTRRCLHLVASVGDRTRPSVFGVAEDCLGGEFRILSNLAGCRYITKADPGGKTTGLMNLAGCDSARPVLTDASWRTKRRKYALLFSGSVYCFPGSVKAGIRPPCASELL